MACFLVSVDTIELDQEEQSSSKNPGTTCNLIYHKLHDCLNLQRGDHLGHISPSPEMYFMSDLQNLYRTKMLLTVFVAAQCL
jgi:hypothetical protein